MTTIGTRVVRFDPTPGRDGLPRGFVPVLIAPAHDDETLPGAIAAAKRAAEVWNAHDRLVAALRRTVENCAVYAGFASIEEASKSAWWLRMFEHELELLHQHNGGTK